MKLAAQSQVPLAPVTFVPPVPSSPWTLTPLANGIHELKLWGKMPPRWLANLTGGLSAQGLSVLRGYAHKLSPTVWQGTFELAAPGSFPKQLDFMSMAQDAPALAGSARIRLDSVKVKPQEQALYVEVSGEDTVGFLMTLLKLFSYYSLYPAEVSIDTPHGRVHDRFWLKGLAGSEPTAEVCATVQAELAKFLGATA